MADVRITFSPDRASAAERLREAVSGSGYNVALARISDVEELIETEDGDQAATVLIWSRPLVSSALRPGLLRKLRQQRKLVEVSPDGVGPDGGEGDSHVILISGWRGQPFHPGWQRLASELKRLCGAPKQVSEGPATVAPEIRAAPQPVPAKTAGGDRPPRAGKLALALLAAVGLFGAGFATSSLLRNTASGTEAPPPAAAQMEEVEPASIAAEPGASPNAGMPEPSAPPKSAGIAPPEPATVEPRPATASPRAAPSSSAAGEGSKPPRKAKKESETRLAKSKAAAQGEEKRYSRRNSEVMRLFCQGSGRSTPQCRTFLRETRGSRR